MVNKFLFTLVGLWICHILVAQEPNVVKIKSLPGEKWWGGMVGIGSSMPFQDNSRSVDLNRENRNNQNVPLFVSSKGRYVWSDKPFTFQFVNGELVISSEFEKVNVQEGGKTLKEAYMNASKNHFPPSGVIPDKNFFSLPQYNTWIELMYNQNQEDILAYARNIVANGFPPGVLMIDDNWQKYYGNYDFKPERFPDAKGMVDELHRMGFKVMLWVCPYLSADSPEYRALAAKKLLIRSKSSKDVAVLRWWNGFSACYDVSNPETAAYIKESLQNVQKKYGIDGFKFDGGDINHFNNPDFVFYNSKALPVDMCRYWAEIGLDFPFNEYRAGWQMGGQALVQRLGDKDYSWWAVQMLIPDMIAAGLLGYNYTCPDMIGGGQFASFLNVKQFDEELIVRSCQTHALMPMMQFSVAPWRILGEKALNACLKASQLHVKMGDYILSMANHAAKTGEPIVRHMEYEFPQQGFDNCKDQFMLGDKYLVAPMLVKGKQRTVQLPKGVWMDDLGKKFRGPKTITIDVPLERLPYFEKIK